MVPGKWWSNKESRWVSDFAMKRLECGYISSCRTMYKFKKAINHINTLEPGSVLTKIYYKHGVRYCRDFVRCNV